MGLPSINVSFVSEGASGIAKAARGTVGLIIVDPEEGALAITSLKHIPDTYAPGNIAYIERAFEGYNSAPRKIIIYAIDDVSNIDDALDYFETQAIDWLAGPIETDTAVAGIIADWVKKRRRDHAKVKAVLPNTAADHEGIVNFTTEGITVGDTIYTTAEYCSRIAGLLAGTSISISCTYAPLYEVTDIERIGYLEMDNAVDDGELILIHDGVKTKIARGVNSLKTVTDTKKDEWKKIKIVEAVDLIEGDIRTFMEDEYVGKYANSYDNKCLLMTAIKSYLVSLEALSVLKSGYSDVQIDLDAHIEYLAGRGVDTTVMSEQEIKEADTGSHVWLKAKIRVLDAIEDIDLAITM